MMFPQPPRPNPLHVPRMIACAALAMMSAAALAAPDVPTVTVRYDDLNLATDAGSMALYRRLRTAAHSVCDLPATRDFRLQALARSCYQRALSEAVGSLHNERLSSIYRAAGGTGPG